MLWFGLTKEARSWWLVAKAPPKVKTKGRTKDPEAMDLDQVQKGLEHPAQRPVSAPTKATSYREDGVSPRKKKTKDPRTVEKDVGRSLEVTPFKYLLRHCVVTWPGETPKLPEGPLESPKETVEVEPLKPESPKKQWLWKTLLCEPQHGRTQQQQQQHAIFPFSMVGIAFLHVVCWLNLCCGMVGEGVGCWECVA